MTLTDQRGRRRLRAGAFTAVVAAATLSIALLPVSASAEPNPDAHYAWADWKLQDWSPDPGPTLLSTKDSTSVTLKKPAGDVGTSLETDNLFLFVEEGCQLEVDVELSDVAIAAAGAVRFFFYNKPGADTSSEAPKAYAAAAAVAQETLSLPITEDGFIGTFGFTYDASNSTGGSQVYARFTDPRLVCDGSPKAIYLDNRILVAPPEPVVTAPQWVCGLVQGEWTWTVLPGRIQIPAKAGLKYDHVGDGAPGPWLDSIDVPVLETGILVWFQAQNGYKLDWPSFWPKEFYQVPALQPHAGECPPVTEEPTTDPTGEPTTQPTTTATTTETTVPTTSRGPASLPVTGSSTPVNTMLVSGAGLVILGAVLLVVTLHGRRKREQVEGSED